MRIREIKIENFRSCRRVVLKLSDFTALVGYNNTGKSNCLSALDFFFNERCALTPEAYWDPAQPIVIDVFLEAESEAETVPGFFEDCICQLRLVAHCNQLPSLFIRHVARDDLVVVSERLQGLLDHCAPYVLHWRAQSRGIVRFETMVEVLCNTLVAQKIFRTQDEFFRGFNVQINQFYPGLRVNAQSDGEGFRLKFRTVVAKYPKVVTVLTESMMHSVRMALLVFLAQFARRIQLETPILLLIDEPEQHLHPVMVEIVAEALLQLSSIDGLQVLLTTHSPVICSSPYAFVNTKIVKKSAQFGTVIATEQRLYARRKTAVEKFLSLSNSSYALFADRVVLVEGVIDKVLLLAIVKKEFREQSAQIGFVVSDGSSLIEDLQHICKSLGLKAKAVSDLDHLKLYEHSRNPAVRTLVAEIKSVMGVGPDATDWPGKNTNEKARIAFVDFAKARPDLCERIHDALLRYGVWIWNSGDIEAVFGFRRHASIELAQDYATRLLSSDLSWRRFVQKEGGNVDILNAWLEWLRR